MDAYDYIFSFDSALSASFWQAIIAFLAARWCWSSSRCSPSPSRRRSCAGWSGGSSASRTRTCVEDPKDKLWWRSPELLGAGAIILLVILNIIFI